MNIDGEKKKKKNEKEFNKEKFITFPIQFKLIY